LVKVSPARSFPEPFRAYGHGASCLSCFGPRTCGRGVTNSSKHRSSQSGFPLLTPTMQAGQDSDVRVGGLEEMCTVHAVIMLCFCCWQGLANRSMRIQDLYVGPLPISRFISLFFKSYARAHVPAYPNTLMRIRTRTHTGSSSNRTEHSRGGIHPCSLCPRPGESSRDAHHSLQSWEHIVLVEVSPSPRSAC
jgi:hypothetical protein